VQLADTGAGIDPATLNLTNVKIRRTSDQQFINANINTDAAGAAITIQPPRCWPRSRNTRSASQRLEGHQRQRVWCRSARSFTTGPTSGAGHGHHLLQDEPGRLDHRPYTSLAWGPDNKLYAARLRGASCASPSRLDRTLERPRLQHRQHATTARRAFIIGMEFDPAATASNPILWVSHSKATDLDLQKRPDWTGKISRLIRPGPRDVPDYVVRPAAPRARSPDQPAQVRPGRRALRQQPSMNAMGAPDPAWVRADHPLSGAMLRMDLSKITARQSM
jgi:hypothetical protein